MNECDKIGLTCSGGQVCKQVGGSYGCSCPDGFKEILDGANKICQGKNCENNLVSMKDCVLLYVNFHLHVGKTSLYLVS